MPSPPPITSSAAVNSLVRGPRAPRQRGAQLQFGDAAERRPSTAECVDRHVEVVAGEAPGVLGTEAEEQARFQPDERDRQLRAHGNAPRQAGVRVEAGGYVQRDHRLRRGVQRGDHAGCRAVDVALQARTEQRIDQQVAPREQLRRTTARRRHRPRSSPRRRGARRA
jgi:hypothetical protein